MKNLLIAGVCASLILPALTGCGGEEKNQVVVNDTTDTKGSDTAQLQEEIFYQIPTPNELFGIIKQIGGKGNQAILHKVEDGSKYSDARQKALNFGIYSADLAYASSYDFGTLNLDYLNLIKKMGEAESAHTILVIRKDHRLPVLKKLFL